MYDFKTYVILQICKKNRKILFCKLWHFSILHLINNLTLKGHKEKYYLSSFILKKENMYSVTLLNAFYPFFSS